MVHLERKQQIEEAAGRLFSERGYAGTSVRDIARELDLQGGSLYAHISSKEEVLWGIIREAGKGFLAAVEPIASGPGTCGERLQAMARAHIRVITADTRSALVFLHEWRFLDQAHRDEILAMRDRYEALYRTLIREGAETGEFTAPDPVTAAAAMLSSLNGVAWWFSEEGTLSPDEIADRISDLYLFGLSGEHQTISSID